MFLFRNGLALLSTFSGSILLLTIYEGAFGTTTIKSRVVTCFALLLIRVALSNIFAILRCLSALGLPVLEYDAFLRGYTDLDVHSDWKSAGAATFSKSHVVFLEEELNRRAQHASRLETRLTHEQHRYADAQSAASLSRAELIGARTELTVLRERNARLMVDIRRETDAMSVSTHAMALATRGANMLKSQLKETREEKQALTREKDGLQVEVQRYIRSLAVVRSALERTNIWYSSWVRRMLVMYALLWRSRRSMKARLAQRLDMLLSLQDDAADSEALNQSLLSLVALLLTQVVDLTEDRDRQLDAREIAAAQYEHLQTRHVHMQDYLEGTEKMVHTMHIRLCGSTCILELDIEKLREELEQSRAGYELLATEYRRANEDVYALTSHRNVLLSALEKTQAHYDALVPAYQRSGLDVVALSRVKDILLVEIHELRNRHAKVLKNSSFLENGIRSYMRQLRAHEITKKSLLAGVLYLWTTNRFLASHRARTLAENIVLKGENEVLKEENEDVKRKLECLLAGHERAIGDLLALDAGQRLLKFEIGALKLAMGGSVNGVGEVDPDSPSGGTLGLLERRLRTLTAANASLAHSAEKARKSGDRVREAYDSLADLFVTFMRHHNDMHTEPSVVKEVEENEGEEERVGLVVQVLSGVLAERTEELCALVEPGFQGAWIDFKDAPTVNLDLEDRQPYFEFDRERRHWVPRERTYLWDRVGSHAVPPPLKPLSGTRMEKIDDVKVAAVFGGDEPGSCQTGEQVLSVPEAHVALAVDVDLNDDGGSNLEILQPRPIRRQTSSIILDELSVVYSRTASESPTQSGPQELAHSENSILIINEPSQGTQENPVVDASKAMDPNIDLISFTEDVLSTPVLHGPLLSAPDVSQGSFSSCDAVRTSTPLHNLGSRTRTPLTPNTSLNQRRGRSRFSPFPVDMSFLDIPLVHVSSGI